MVGFQVQLSPYAICRRARLEGLEFHEGTANPGPPEQLLQRIWNHQRLLRSSLRTSDGRKVTVFHPGFWNRGAGPDFKGAVVQIEPDEPRSGDVEIDLASNGWFQHRHHENRLYRQVLLHVVWNPPEPGARRPDVPSLPLSDVLDSPLEELRSWLLDAPSCPQSLAGQCNAPLQHLREDLLLDLLQQAAEVRLQSKAQEFLARARATGWDQALWEGLFTALGYTQNTWPMRRLAELRPRWFPNPSDATRSTPERLQSLLLGIAGLIPSAPENLPADSAQYVGKLWESWWRERDAMSDLLIAPAAWQWHGIRPANHPQRRIALAAHWSADASFVERVESWIRSDAAPGRARIELNDALRIAEDSFWACHWTMESPAFDKPRELLGAERVTDIAMNVILPWAWIRARLGKNLSLEASIRRRYFEFPASGWNSVLRMAETRLFAGRPGRFMSLASHQQGVLQIVRDFCRNSDAICTRCKFPEVVRALQSG